MQPLSIFLFALHLCFSIPLLMLFCCPGVPSPLISLLHLFKIIHISQTYLKFHSLVNFSLDLPRELFYLLNLESHGSPTFSHLYKYYDLSCFNFVCTCAFLPTTVSSQASKIILMVLHSCPHLTTHFECAMWPSTHSIFNNQDVSLCSLGISH